MPVGDQANGVLCPVRVLRPRGLPLLQGLPNKSTIGFYVFGFGCLYSFLLTRYFCCLQTIGMLNGEQTAYLQTALLQHICAADPDANRSVGLHLPIVDARRRHIRRIELTHRRSDLLTASSDLTSCRNPFDSATFLVIREQTHNCWPHVGVATTAIGEGTKPG